MTNPRTKLVLPAFIITAIVGYLVAFRIPVGGKGVVIWPYEIIILAGILPGRHARLEPVHFGVAIWSWLAGLAILVGYFLNAVPLDVWFRGVVITAKCVFALYAIFLASSIDAGPDELVRIKRLIIIAILAYGVAMLAIEVARLGARNISDLTRFRLGSYEVTSGPLLYVNPNQLGQMLALAFSALVSDGRRWPWRAPLVLASTVLMTLTFSREALLTVGMYLLLGIRSKRSVAAILVVGAVIASVAFAAFLAPADLYSAGRSRLTSFLSPTDSLVRARIDVAWAPLWAIIQSHLIVGAGPDGIGFLSGTLLGQTVGNGDNMFLGALAAYGLLGLFGLLVFVVLLTVTLSRKSRWFGGGEFAFVNRYVVAYVVSGLVSPHFLWPYNSINALVMLLVGLSLSETRRRSSQSTVCKGDLA